MKSIYKKIKNKKIIKDFLVRTEKINNPKVSSVNVYPDRIIAEYYIGKQKYDWVLRKRDAPVFFKNMNQKLR